MSTMVVLYAPCVSTNRWAGAKCTGYRELPWTDDAEPDAADIRAMQSICAECPVLARCANYAITGGDGGFYAGIWVPWSKTMSEPLMATRRNARTALRHIARRAPVTA